VQTSFSLPRRPVHRLRILCLNGDKPVKAVHGKKLPQFSVRVEQNDLAPMISRFLVQTKYFTRTGTVDKGDFHEIDDYQARAFIQKIVKTILKGGAIFVGYLALDTYNSFISVRFYLDVHGFMRQNTVSHYEIRSKHLIAAPSRFVVHLHKAGRSHFDLRIIQEDILRSWSLLKEPPQRPGQQRLAIQRESFPPEALARGMFEEEAFGKGNVVLWDKGIVAIEEASPMDMRLSFEGDRIRGGYRLTRMEWYPGNRWIMTRLVDRFIYESSPGQSNLP
jgi:DNA ligase D-like protein (predicted 3'-phosphoesterase)